MTTHPHLSLLTSFPCWICGRAWWATDSRTRCHILPTVSFCCLTRCPHYISLITFTLSLSFLLALIQRNANIHLGKMASFQNWVFSDTGIKLQCHCRFIEERETLHLRICYNCQKFQTCNYCCHSGNFKWSLNS